MAAELQPSPARSISEIQTLHSLCIQADPDIPEGQSVFNIKETVPKDIYGCTGLLVSAPPEVSGLETIDGNGRHQPFAEERLPAANSTLTKVVETGGISPVSLVLLRANICLGPRQTRNCRGPLNTDQLGAIAILGCPRDELTRPHCLHQPLVQARYGNQSSVNIGITVGILW
ncbi:hypothetical protein [Rhizobium leguminosarum]|uniref:hypothetical protein n=1 Tax=Rhizobium leguminosarum TaxID=384 RepID=UPI003F9DA403